MIKKIVFQLENGKAIVIEVEEERESLQRVAARRGTEYGEIADMTFENALAVIKPAAETIINTLSDLNNSPDEIEVEFGVKMHLELGAVITTNSTESNYKIKLAWKHNTADS